MTNNIDTTTPLYGYVTTDGGFTIECWMNRATVVGGTGYEALFTQRTQAPVTWVNGEKGRTLWFGMNVNPAQGFTLVLSDQIGTLLPSYVDTSPNGYHNDGQWHHVALVLDKATKRQFSIYLDGALYQTQPAALSSDLNWLPGVITIAGGLAKEIGNTGFNAWNEKMAYVAIFNKELTAAQIQSHFLAGSGGEVFSGDTENERLTRIFEWSDIPPNYRQLEDDDTVLQGFKIDQTNALDQAQNTAADAGGYLFADGQGVMRKHNRRHRYNRWVELALGEEVNSTAPEVGMKFQTFEKYIYNDIRGSRPNGTKVRMQNSESQDANGRKVYSIEISVTDHEELLNSVLWILSRYGTDSVRVTGMKFECTTSYVLKELAYGRVEIGDVITLDNLPNPAPTQSMEFVVEGIDVDIDFLGKTWFVELTVSPHSLNKVFQICTSLLGDGSLIGY